MELTENDVAVLAGLTASLEGYLRVDPGDPTARAHALRHLARRAVEDLGAEGACRRRRGRRAPRPSPTLSGPGRQSGWTAPEPAASRAGRILATTRRNAFRSYSLRPLW